MNILDKFFESKQTLNQILYMDTYDSFTHQNEFFAFWCTFFLFGFAIFSNTTILCKHLILIYVQGYIYFHMGKLNLFFIVIVLPLCLCTNKHSISNEIEEDVDYDQTLYYQFFGDDEELMFLCNNDAQSELDKV